MRRAIALRFETEAYRLSAERIMGRQAAGDGFLRALVNQASGVAVRGYGPDPRAHLQLKELLDQFGGQELGEWILPHNFGELTRLGHLHYPDPSFVEAAQIRSLTGTGRWSISGVTHTTASQTVINHIKSMATASVMPWDALICTSLAVRHSVETLLQDEEDRLREKLNATRFDRPQLPIIPLGIHSKDFETTTARRQKARSELKIGEDEIVFLFVGRLSFHAKAHPYQMYRALNEVALTLGKKIVLIQCGWFANEAIQKAFHHGAQTFAPDIRQIYLDGRKSIDRESGWSAADIFISLSDNIQETFGLTPIEAMAAGLPVIISDWNGYRDTVRHGEDGFLIPSLMPGPETDDKIGLAFMSGAINYDHYLAWASLRVSVDPALLRDAITALVSNSELRSKMGRSGRQRVKMDFEWSNIINQYRSLWSDLDARRIKDSTSLLRSRGALEAKRVSPYRLFFSYPTATIGAETRIYSKDEKLDYLRIVQHELFSGVARSLPPEPLLKRMIEIVRSSGSKSLSDLAEDLKVPVSLLIDAAAILTKWEIIGASGKKRDENFRPPSPSVGDSNVDIYQRIKTDLIRLLSLDDHLPHRLRMGLKLLAKLRATELQQQWVTREGTKILSGPYAGMEFLAESTEGCHIPKLIGSYEAPLVPIISKLCEGGYHRIINAGCAEGYHAIGLARLIPNAEILAFDRNPLAQKACQTVAEKNNTSNRLKIDGELKVEHLNQSERKKTLFFCDIEGAELDLISKAPSKTLAQLDILVECHDLFGKDVSKSLSEVLAPTHNITLIKDDGARSAALPEWVFDLSHIDQALLFWEWRDGPTPWIFAEAITK